MNLYKLNIFLVTILLTSCHSPISKELESKKSDFHIEALVKADIDMFADALMEQSIKYLRLLARKLYLRNPNQLSRGKQQDIQQAIARLFISQWPRGLKELYGNRSVDAIQLAFDESFQGDRVAALIAGLRDMLLDAYGGNQEFYLHNEFEPQKIYNLARNFEVAFWKLNHDRNSSGKLYLLSNSITQETVTNLSYERLYGKLIAIHDYMAIVIANTTNRRIKNIIQRAATMVFLPI